MSRGYHQSGLSRRDFFKRLAGGIIIPYLSRLPRFKGAAASTLNDLYWVKQIPDHPFYDPGQVNYHLGLDSLLYLMADSGLKFYRSSDGSPLAGPSGLIAADDVVLIKVNAQWKYRGCTNSDLVCGLIQRLLDHPEGFRGEVVIIENGQGRGSLNCDTSAAYDGDTSVRANANDANHSFLYLVNHIFRDPRVSAFLLDPIREQFIGNSNHSANGYRKYENVSYPCFTTAGGRRVELREGVWQGSGYRSNLKLINVPVLKHHDTGGSEITASLKHMYGLLSMSDGQSGFRHYSGLGETCGRMMASVRTPVLNIVDAIWVSYSSLTGYPAGSTFRANELLASQDPVAADYWAAKYILYPVDSNFRHHPEFSGVDSWLTQALNTINSRGGLLDPAQGVLVDQVTKREDQMRVQTTGAGEFLNRARLSVSSTALQFTASTAQLQTLEKTFRVAVSGARPLAWSIESDAAWIICSPSSGAGDASIAVLVRTAGLGPGRYTGRILIHCPGAANTPETVSVALNIRETRKRHRAESRSKF
jgi:hypothetical protein